MTTSVSPQRALTHKSTLIGVPAPTPTRKDGTPILLADTPPEGFHKAKLPKTDAPPVAAAPSDAPSPGAPVGDAARADAPRVLTQQAIDAIKAASATSDPEKVDASTRVTRRDLPVQGGSRPSIHVAPASGLSSSSRLLALSAAVAALILGGRWFFMSRHVAEPAADVSASTPTGVQVVPPQAETAPAAAPPAEPSAAPAAPEPAASATPEPSPAGSAASTEKPPGTRIVVVKLSPPGARLFRKGKPVGSSPVTIELGPDEKKRSFEVGMP
ncbi:MAG TPA: hypothetical protein VFV94_11370, partial [Polyangiaceae bacterium]|nr:hypothetical protein [Polyangiaceae bacterium]